MGIYGAETVMLGPNCSILFRPNPLFVQSIKVEELDSTATRIELYGFYNSPPLDVETNWSEIYNAVVPSDSHTAWILYLNEGAQVNISYTVNSTVSCVYLIIAQGTEGLVKWLEDPTYPNTTLSWNIVQGSGVIQQNIYKSSSYYVALGNLNSEDVEALGELWRGGYHGSLEKSNLLYIIIFLFVAVAVVVAIVWQVSLHDLS